MLGPMLANISLVRTPPQTSGAVKNMGKKSAVPTTHPTIIGCGLLSQVVVLWRIPNLELFKDQGGVFYLMH